MAARWQAGETALTLGRTAYNQPTMDKVAYFLALLIYLMVPPAFGFWFLVHPFIAFWRRLGVVRAYLLLSVAMLIAVATLYFVRTAALKVHFELNPGLAVLGMLLLVVSFILRMKLERELGRWTLIGRTEIAGDASTDGLATAGIYSHIRHPRYVEGVLLLAGFAFITNYLVVYVIWLLYLPLMLILVHIEERELVARYGKRYTDYRARVPRFIPRCHWPRSA